MSEIIDERVVEMEFDNSGFEKNANKSIDTLKNLSSALQLDGATSGLNAIGDAIKNTDTTHLTESIDGLTSRFSTLGIIGTTALINIANRLTNMGIGLAKNLSIDQISAGWSKYGEKTKSVQTIVSATGRDIDYVNDKLDKLNWFTDETSYNLTDMTNNIGKFTSQGIELDEAVTAMQGIGTWASISGQGVNEASRAMYNLSQAIGVGSVKLMDWRSVENANMGTKGFKETVIETAIELNKLKKVGDGVYKDLKGKQVTIANFSQSLATGWFDKDVLVTTLKKYGGFAEGVNEIYRGLVKIGNSKTTSDIIDDLKTLSSATDEELKSAGYSTDELIAKFKEMSSQTDGIGAKSFAAAQEAKTLSEAIGATQDAVSTGWLNTFEIIFGNYEQAKVLWTGLANELYEIFAEGSAERNETLKGAFSMRETSESYIAELTKLSKESVEKLGAVAKASGTASDEYKSLIEEMSNSDSSIAATLNMFGDFVSSGKDMGEYLGIFAHSTKDAGDKLIEIGEASGYSSTEFRTAMTELTKGNRDIEGTVIKLLEMNKAMESLTGREALFSGIGNIWSTIKDNMFAVKDTFYDVFPKKDSEAIYKGLIGFEVATKKFKLTEEQTDKLKITFKGLFDVIGIFRDGVVSLFGAISGSNLHLGKLTDSLLDISASIGRVLSGVREGIRELGLFDHIFVPTFRIISAIIGKLSDILSVSGKTIANFFGLKGEYKFDSAGFNILKYVLEAIDNALTGLAKSIEMVDLSKITSGIGGFGEGMSGLRDRMHGVGQTLQEMAINFKNSELAANLWTLTATVLGKAWEGLSVIVHGIGEGLKNAFTGASFQNLLTLVNAGGISALIFAFVKGGGVIKNFISTISGAASPNGGITQVFGAIKDGWETLTTALSNNTNTEAMKKMATALAILAGAVFILTLVNPGKLIASVGAIEVLMTTMTKSIKSMGGGLKKSGLAGSASMMSESIKVVGTMTSMAISLFILAGAVRLIANIEWKKLLKSLVVVEALMWSMVGVAKAMSSNSKVFIKGGGTLLLLAASLRIMAGVLKVMDSMDPGKSLANALVLSVVLGELLAFARLMNNVRFKVSSATSLLILAGTIQVVVNAISKLGDIPTDTLTQGLIGIFAILTELGMFMASMSFISKSMIGTSIALLIVSGSLTILAGVIAKMGSLSGSQIAKGLGTIAAVLIELGVALALLKSGVGGAVSLTVAALAIGLLAKSLKLVGNMSMKEILKGLGGLAGILTVLGVSATLMAPIVPILAALSGAMILFGIGLAAIGGGLTLTSAGLLSLIGAVSGGAVAIVTAIKMVLVGIVAAGAEIIQAATVLITSLIIAVKESIPLLVETIVECVMTLADQLAVNAPKLADDIFQLLIGVIHSLAVHLPELASAVGELITALFEAVVNLLGQIDLNTIAEGIIIGGMLAALVAGLSAIAPMIPTAALAIAGIGALLVELTVILTILGGIYSNEGVRNLMNSAGQFFASLGNIVGSFLGGIVGGFGTVASSALPAIGKNIANFWASAAPFFFGMKSIGRETVDSAKSLVGVITSLTGASFLDGIAKLFGAGNLTGFAAQIGPIGKGVASFGQEVAGIDPESIIAGAKAAESLVDVMSNNGHISNPFGDGTELDGYIMALAKFNNESLASLNISAIQNTITAGEMFDEFAKKLNEGGTLYSSFTNLSSFGDEITTFADAIAEYSSRLIDTNFNPAVVGASVDTLKRLIDVLCSASGVDVNGLSAFVDGITQIPSNLMEFGSSTVTEFCQAFIDGVPKVKESVTAFYQAVIETLSSVESDTTQNGSTFASIALKHVNSYVQGILAKVDSATTAGRAMASATKTGANNQIQTFYSVGQACVTGFVNGINSKRQEAYNAGWALGIQAKKGAQNAIDSHSPSREFLKLGVFSGEGLILGLAKMAKQVYNAGYELGNDSLDGIRSAIDDISEAVNSDIETNPVITPVLNLDELRGGASKLAGMFGSVELDTYYARANIAKATASNDGGYGEVHGETKNITLNQYNYSPRELSRLEIYRNTKNLISATKGMVVTQ